MLLWRHFSEPKSAAGRCRRTKYIHRVYLPIRLHIRPFWHHILGVDAVLDNMEVPGGELGGDLFDLGIEPCDDTLLAIAAVPFTPSSTANVLVECVLVEYVLVDAPLLTDI
jgi:hypothetical protein